MRAERTKGCRESRDDREVEPGSPANLRAAGIEDETVNRRAQGDQAEHSDRRPADSFRCARVGRPVGPELCPASRQNPAARPNHQTARHAYGQCDDVLFRPSDYGGRTDRDRNHSGEKSSHAGARRVLGPKRHSANRLALGQLPTTTSIAPDITSTVGPGVRQRKIIAALRAVQNCDGTALQNRLDRGENHPPRGRRTFQQAAG